jgi:hypothetical protein
MVVGQIKAKHCQHASRPANQEAAGSNEDGRVPTPTVLCSWMEEGMNE